MLICQIHPWKARQKKPKLSNVTLPCAFWRLWPHRELPAQLRSCMRERDDTVAVHDPTLEQTEGTAQAQNQTEPAAPSYLVLPAYSAICHFYLLSGCDSAIAISSHSSTFFPSTTTRPHRNNRCAAPNCFATRPRHSFVDLSQSTSTLCAT